MIRNIAKTLGLAMLAGLLAFAACDEGGPAPPSAGSITGDVTIEGRGLDGVSVTLSNGTSDESVVIAPSDLPPTDGQSLKGVGAVQCMMSS